MPSFIKIVKAIKKVKFNLPSTSELSETVDFVYNFFCTTLYRNLMQASNFGGTFHQLSFELFFEIFTEDASPHFFYTMVQKSKNDQKLKSRGVLPERTPLRLF